VNCAADEATPECFVLAFAIFALDDLIESNVFLNIFKHLFLERCVAVVGEEWASDVVCSGGHGESLLVSFRMVNCVGGTCK
jgi:hypothetical protein